MHNTMHLRMGAHGGEGTDEGIEKNKSMKQGVGCLDQHGQN